MLKINFTRLNRSVISYDNLIDWPRSRAHICQGGPRLSARENAKKPIFYASSRRIRPAIYRAGTPKLFYESKCFMLLFILHLDSFSHPAAPGVRSVRSRILYTLRCSVRVQRGGLTIFGGPHSADDDCDQVDDDDDDCDTGREGTIARTI